MQRLRSIQSDGPVLALWFSDGFESCQESLKAVPAPQSDVQAVGVLLGEKVGLVTQKPAAKGKKAPPAVTYIQGGYEQFQERREALQQAAPWLTTFSQYEVSNYARLFSRPRREAARQP